MMRWWLWFGDLIHQARNSGKVSLGLVYFSLLLDGFLLTVVVPILPDYLYQLELAEDAEKLVLYCQQNSTLCLKNNTYILPQDIINENSKVGWLFSSKAIVQLFTNGLVGMWANRIGYTIPLFSGVLALTVSAWGFALSESYALLFASRAIHGLGAACLLIAGMGLLADTYPDDKDRSRVMGIALSGQAVGVLVGYPAGGILYQFVGKTAPFLLCAVFLIINAVLQLIFMQPSCRNVASKVNGTPLHTLLVDPYILVAAGALMLPEMSMAMLEPTLPIWLADSMHLERWQVGMIFIPDSIGFVLGTTAFGVISYRLGRWICSICSLLMVGLCLALIPCATRLPHLIVPHFGLGFGLGIMDACIMPLLALLVDQRHVAVYGSVYAIAQFSISLGFAIGPSVGGQIVKTIGFGWLLRGMAVCNLLFAPLCYFLRNPPMNREHKRILSDVNGRRPSTRKQSSSSANFGYQQFD